MLPAACPSGKGGLRRTITAMRDWNAVDVRVTEGAGQFSFMDIPPPHATEPLLNKHGFLREYSSEICKFVVG